MIPSHLETLKSLVENIFVDKGKYSQCSAGV